MAKVMSGVILNLSERDCYELLDELRQLPKDQVGQQTASLAFCLAGIEARIRDRDLPQKEED